MILGSRTSISFPQIGLLTEMFHIHSCVATNGKNLTTDPLARSLELVTAGCISDDAKSVEIINPILDQSVRSLSFGQFGFAAKNGNQNILEFRLECILQLGDAPECSSRRRRDTDEHISIDKRAQVEYTVQFKVATYDDDYQVQDGLVLSKVRSVEKFETSGSALLGSFVFVYAFLFL